MTVGWWDGVASEEEERRRADGESELVNRGQRVKSQDKCPATILPVQTEVS